MQKFKYSKLDSCSFPPDRWQPGCPLSDNKRKWTYDKSGHLTGYSELGINTVDKLVYKDDTIVSAKPILVEEKVTDDGVVKYKQRGDEVRVVNGSRTLKIVELSKGLPKRVRSYNLDDGSLSMEHTYVARAGRPIKEKITMHLLGVSKELWTRQWKYAGCGATK